MFIWVSELKFTVGDNSGFTFYSLSKFFHSAQPKMTLEKANPAWLGQSCLQKAWTYSIISNTCQCPKTEEFDDFKASLSILIKQLPELFRTHI